MTLLSLCYFVSVVALQVDEAICVGIAFTVVAAAVVGVDRVPIGVSRLL